MTSFVGVLISCPLTNLQKASKKLCEHFEGLATRKAKKYHLTTVQVAERFRTLMESKEIPIAKTSKYIAETVIFCGRQGIVLRGHHDDWKHVDKQTQANPGNFVALLQFKLQSGDKVLADHLASNGSYSLYKSKTTHAE